MYGYHTYPVQLLHILEDFGTARPDAEDSNGLGKNSSPLSALLSITML